MEHKACPTVMLVRNEVGQVSISPTCGQIQLTLQYISLRFGAEAFRALTSLLLQAQSRLDRAEMAWAANESASPGDGFH